MKNGQRLEHYCELISDQGLMDAVFNKPYHGDIQMPYFYNIKFMMPKETDVKKVGDSLNLYLKKFTGIHRFYAIEGLTVAYYEDVNFRDRIAVTMELEVEFDDIENYEHIVKFIKFSKLKFDSNQIFMAHTLFVNMRADHDGYLEDHFLKYFESMYE